MPLHDSMLRTHGLHESPKILFSSHTPTTPQLQPTQQLLGSNPPPHIGWKMCLAKCLCSIGMQCNSKFSSEVSPGTLYAITGGLGKVLSDISLVSTPFVALLLWDLRLLPTPTSAHNLHIITPSKCCHTSESWNDLQPCWRSPTWAVIAQSTHLI